MSPAVGNPVVLCNGASGASLVITCEQSAGIALSNATRSNVDFGAANCTASAGFNTAGLRTNLPGGAPAFRFVVPSAGFYRFELVGRADGFSGAVEVGWPASGIDCAPGVSAPLLGVWERGGTNYPNSRPGPIFLSGSRTVSLAGGEEVVVCATVTTASGEPLAYLTGLGLSITKVQ